MPRDEFLGGLNQYFDCMAAAVVAHDGEVLRFIGDAALAVLLISDDEQKVDATGATSAQAASSNALDAAITAAWRMSEMKAGRCDAVLVELGYGIGLHIVEVTYGTLAWPSGLSLGSSERPLTGSPASRACASSRAKMS